MNLQQKSKMVVVFLSAVIMGLVSCKKDYDVMTAFKDLANKNINGTFVLWDVDTTNLQTTLYQYSLDKESKTGAFYTFAAGHNLSQQEDSVLFNFQQGDFVEQNLFVDVLLYNDETSFKKHVKWGNNAIYDGEKVLNSATDAYKMFGNLLPVVGQDDLWFGGDTAKFETIDTVKQDYMYWKGTQNQKNITRDSLDKLLAFFDQQWVKDTIKWFNACLDPQVKTTITTIPDTIRYAEKSGKFTAVVPTYDIRQKLTEIHHLVGYEHIYTCTVYLNNVSDVRTCYYKLDTIENTREVFDNPTSPKAIAREKHISLADGNWCISKVNYAKGFDVLLKGHYQYEEKINGQVQPTPVDETNYVLPAVITNYSYTDKKKEMSFNNIPLKLVNK